MTVKRLHDLLGRLIEEGHARKPVVVDKATFTHPLESDGCVVLDVYGVDLACIRQIDDDGGIKINKDGTESSKVSVVLSGIEPREKGY